MRARIKKAVQAVREGESVRSAAKKYSIPRSTLKDRISGITPMETLGCGGYYSVLGRDIEMELVDALTSEFGSEEENRTWMEKIYLPPPEYKDFPAVGSLNEICSMPSDSISGIVVTKPKRRPLADLLDNFITYPEERMKKRKVQERRAPCVLTSDSWIEFRETEQEDKIKKEKEKEDRKCQRESALPGIGDLLPIGPNLSTNINRISNDFLTALQPPLETLTECTAENATRLLKEEIRDQYTIIRDTVTYFELYTNVFKTVDIAGPIDEIGSEVSNFIRAANSTCTSSESRYAISTIGDVTIAATEELADVLQVSKLPIPQTVYDSIKKSNELISSATYGNVF
ncbi:hypothetical protein DMENIID0001_155150 [Sergentomyia squamirostris]